MLDRDEQELQRLEDELRRGRPEPRPEFLADLVSRVEQPAPEPKRAFGFRLGLAVAFAAAFLVTGAAFGAFGYAGSSARDAVEQTAGVVSDIVGSDRAANRRPPSTATRGSESSAGVAGAATAFAGSTPSISTKSGHYEYPKFVVVCVRVFSHNVTIVIPSILIPLIQPWIVNFGPCNSGPP